MVDLVPWLNWLAALCFLPCEASFAPIDVGVDDLRVGDGVPARVGDRVTLHFTAWSGDGKELASTERRGLTYTTLLAADAPAYLLQVAGMAEGGERTVRVPAGLAHGLEGMPPVIPAASSLVVRFRLVKVVQAPEPEIQPR